MTNPLFRPEALSAQKANWTGSVILTTPISFTFLSLCAFAIALVLVGFLVWGEYTKRSTVKGQLIPDKGLVQAYTTTAGVITEKYITDGQEVKAGDLLYKISTARYSDDSKISTQKALASELVIKKQLTEHEITRTKQAQTAQRQSIANTIEQLNIDLERVQRQIKLQQQQIAIAQSTLERYELAKQSEAVSAQELSNQQMAYNAQLENLSGLEREKANIEKQVQEQKITLNRLDGEHQAVLLQYNKTLSDNQSEIIQNLASDTVLIKAQVDGVVSVSYAEIGQFVDSSRTLASILPSDSQLIAQLYVPSRAIGFVKTDDKVLLRYAAYPYQKFGHATGKIDTVAKTASASQSLPTIGTVFGVEQSIDEPVYIIKVKLDKQSITAYGQQLPLVAGMTLDGDIMHETRKLYEWVLEPLYSITGKVGSRSFINTP